jgi:hypothetical protein
MKAELKIRECVLCGERTLGAIGAAGLYWSMLCQPCKDKEDHVALETLKIMKCFDSMLEKLLPQGGDANVPA